MQGKKNSCKCKKGGKKTKHILAKYAHHKMLLLVRCVYTSGQKCAKNSGLNTV